MLTTHDRKLLTNAVRKSERSGNRRETCWWLLTGSPRSGKTTVARMLKDLGWHVIDDQGRVELNAMTRHNSGPLDAKRNYLDFQFRVLGRYLSIQDSIDSRERVVFDYGASDALVFMKLAGIKWQEEFLQAAVGIRFERIFTFESLNERHEEIEDSHRLHDSAERSKLAELFQDLYSSLGYDLKTVPKMSKTDRVNFILSQ